MERNQSAMVMDTPAERRSPVDAEHGRLRLAVVVVFVISGILGYIVINMLVPAAGLNILAILGSFAVAYAITAIFEQALKRRWPSGRSVEVSDKGVQLVKNGEAQQTIDASKPVTSLMWRFQTKRRSRVPKGWYLLACAVEQEDNNVSVYALMSPDQFKKIEDNERFKVLKAKADTNATGNRGRDDLLLAGEQRRLLAAENHRWQSGAEMSVDDFQAYVELLNRRFPEWFRVS